MEKRARGCKRQAGAQRNIRLHAGPNLMIIPANNTQNCTAPPLQLHKQTIRSRRIFIIVAAAHTIDAIFSVAKDAC
jgi:hypothetical protein